MPQCRCSQRLGRHRPLALPPKFAGLLRNLKLDSQLQVSSLVPDFSKSGIGRGRGSVRVPDSGQIGDEDGGAPGKSGTGPGPVGEPRARANRGRRSRPRPRANRGRGRGQGPGLPRPGSTSAWDPGPRPGAVRVGTRSLAGYVTSAASLSARLALPAGHGVTKKPTQARAMWT